MTALTADRDTLRRAPGRATYLAGVDVLYNGALACFNSSGYVMAAAATALYRLAGVVDGQVDNSSGSAGDAPVTVFTEGEFLFGISSASQSDVGTAVYVSDDQTVTTTRPAGATAIYAGEIREVPSSTTVWVDIGPAVGQLEGQLQTIKGSLTAGTSTDGGDVLSLANPFGEDVYILGVGFDITTAATGTPTADVGVAANGTTSDDTLMDGVAIGDATKFANAIGHAGTNGVGMLKWGSSEYVTATPSASAAGLVGTYHILVWVPTAR